MYVCVYNSNVNITDIICFCNNSILSGNIHLAILNRALFALNREINFRIKFTACIVLFILPLNN